MKIIIDIETDSLDATVVHCVVTKELDSDDYRVWTRPDYPELRTYLRDAVLIGHNILGFDLPVLQKLLGLDHNWGSCIDTLVVSRLRNSWDYSDHSLDAWGERLGYPKLPFKDFDKLTPEMITYCKRDVEITYHLYKKFEKYLSSKQFHRSLALEHHSAYLCNKIRENGFHFDLVEAEVLHSEILEHREYLLDKIHRA